MSASKDTADVSVSTDSKVPTTAAAGGLSVPVSDEMELKASLQKMRKERNELEQQYLAAQQEIRRLEVGLWNRHRNRSSRPREPSLPGFYDQSILIPRPQLGLC